MILKMRFSSMLTEFFNDSINDLSFSSASSLGSRSTFVMMTKMRISNKRVVQCANT